MNHEIGREQIPSETNKYACLLACLLANKIIHTAKDIGSYFFGYLIVSMHAL
jgi:hypothetical protein